MSELFIDSTAIVISDARGAMTVGFVCQPGVGGCASVRRENFRNSFASELDPEIHRFGFTGFCQQHPMKDDSDFATPPGCEMDGQYETAMGTRTAKLYIEPSTITELQQAGVTIEPGNPSGVVVKMADK
ncbi:hypothetical protein KBB12_00770 [Candidatus Woesebacteria bacterium]|nr:hypothetical protein [Candidatus Woesebacteria bacterium]